MDDDESIGLAPLQQLQVGGRLRADLLGLQRIDLQPKADRPDLLLGILLGRAPSADEAP
jgi:hypothetical protein